MRILVVDDEAPLRTLAKMSLERRGHQVDQAGGGNEAARLIAADPSAYALIITDLTMPDGDGLVVLTAAFPHRIPVIVCSGYQTEEHRKKALDAGAKLILDKPVSPTVLADAADRLLAGG